MTRLVGMVLAEHDGWPDERCYLRPESMTPIETDVEREEVAPALLMVR